MIIFQLTSNHVLKRDHYILGLNGCKTKIKVCANLKSPFKDLPANHFIAIVLCAMVGIPDDLIAKNTNSRFSTKNSHRQGQNHP